MKDECRTEPSFKLQGSYWIMSKLVSKVAPIINGKELQTLTSAAEANLLKYKELTTSIAEDEITRWEVIKETFVKNNKLKRL